MNRPYITIDGNEAAAYVAHKINEVIAIYPITPSSPMGEFSDQWSSDGQPNIWGTIPHVIEMQSEAGAAGALHGALQGGALGTTFTSAQGLLLMIPNMYKIAGELTACVLHVAARSLAAHALSIFGDHQDVMSVRGVGFAMLASNSVQEVMDMALIAQAASMESRVPFVHFFDGFRTSHEVAKVQALAREDLQAMISDELVHAHRQRGLTPDRPMLRGTAQNPDVYFQGRETVNPYYLAVPTIVQNQMDKFAGLVGRKYELFQYSGAPDAERVIILTGSGAEVAEEAVDAMVEQGQKVGLSQGPPLSSVLGGALPGGSACQHEEHRGAGPHQGAGQPGRADVPGCVDGAGGGAGQRHAEVCHAEGDRWPLRSLFQGIHAGDGQGYF